MNEAHLLTKEPNQAQIYSEQLRSVYFNFTPALIGTTVASLLILLLQWHSVETSLLLVWFFLFLSVNFARGLLVYAFNRKDPDDKTCQVWGWRFYLSTVAAGAVWAIGVYIAFPEEQLSQQLTLAIVIVGISAGAVSTISVLISSFVVFVFPMMLTLISLFVFEGNDTSYVLAFSLLFILIYIYRGALNINNASKHNIMLRINAERREQDLEQARYEAEKSNRAKSEFLAKMSHEIRTPLHGIMSFTYFGMQKIKTAPREKIVEYFHQISTSSERLKVLLDDLLDLSKLESGKIDFNFRQADLHLIVHNCISEQRILLDEKQLTIEYTDDEGVNNIVCDKIRIGQVIMNLLSNAIKFTPLGSTIGIRLELEKDLNNANNNTVKLSISDQGPGVPEDETKTIFRKFLQGSAIMESNQGAGLGLAICKEIITAHLGDIWCENNEKHGVTFSFSIPANQS